jgi:hypothetical protein
MRSVDEIPNPVKKIQTVFGAEGRGLPQSTLLLEIKAQSIGRIKTALYILIVRSVELTRNGDFFHVP